MRFNSCEDTRLPLPLPPPPLLHRVKNYEKLKTHPKSDGCSDRTFCTIYGFIVITSTATESSGQRSTILQLAMNECACLRIFSYFVGSWRPSFALRLKNVFGMRINRALNFLCFFFASFERKRIKGGIARNCERTTVNSIKTIRARIYLLLLSTPSYNVLR